MYRDVTVFNTVLLLNTTVSNTSKPASKRRTGRPAESDIVPVSPNKDGLDGVAILQEVPGMEKQSASVQIVTLCKKSTEKDCAWFFCVCVTYMEPFAKEIELYIAYKRNCTYTVSNSNNNYYYKNNDSIVVQVRIDYLITIK